MKVSTRYARRVITPGARTPIDLIVELVAPPAPAIERPSVDTAIVIDRSGSMSGLPLDHVKRAVIDLLRHIGPDDRLAVVAFDTNVEVILPLDRHVGDDPIRRITEIQAGSSTNLSGGWLEGLRLLATAGRPDAIRRVITLTDGHANQGIVGLEELGTLVRGGRQRGVTSSFIGFDDGYDELLLAGLADAGGGNDYWCDGPDKAAEVFLDEFGSLAAVIAQNLAVTVTPTVACTDVGLLHDFAVVDGTDRSFTVNLGDTYGDETRKVALRFHLAGDLELGDQEIATIEVGWAAVGAEPALHTITQPVVVRIDDDPNAPDPDADSGVVEEVLNLEAAKVQRDGADAAEAGDFERASALFATSVELLRRGGADERRIAELERIAAEAARGGWSLRERKRQYSSSRSAMRGRRSDYVDDTRDQQ